jgi:uncharacterized membrane protein
MVSMDGDTPRPSTGARLRRLLRHRWHDETDAARRIGPEARARLQAQVVASEAAHSGEIRICVEAALPLRELWRGVTPRQRAQALFGALGVWDTEHDNGVLVYLLLAERAIEIVADRALARHVPQAEWDALLQAMAGEFRAGRFEAGLAQAVAAVDQRLRRHFPLPAGARDVNELPDAVVLL